MVERNFRDADSNNVPKPGNHSVPDFKSARTAHNPEVTSVQKLLSEISTGLRILEDRYSNLRKKTQITDQAILDAQRSFESEKRVLNDELLDTKIRLQDFAEDLDAIKAELSESVEQKDFLVLDKYLDMWEPLEFVTRQEVEEALKRKFDEKKLSE